MADNSLWCSLLTVSVSLSLSVSAMTVCLLHAPAAGEQFPNAQSHEPCKLDILISQSSKLLQAAHETRLAWGRAQQRETMVGTTLLARADDPKLGCW